MKPKLYEQLNIIIDTREQNPWTFEGFEGQIKRATMKSGDYTIWGFHKEFAIERKSMDDYLGSITHGRDRFEREMARLSCLRRACVIVEGSRATIAVGDYQSLVAPNAALSTADSFWLKYNVPFFFEPTRALAEDRALRIMKLWWKRYHRYGLDYNI